MVLVLAGRSLASVSGPLRFAPKICLGRPYILHDADPNCREIARHLLFDIEVNDWDLIPRLSQYPHLPMLFAAM
jgi:hypothetical protein